MSFLNRLSPPREGDRSRAVAVLPSRFAGVGPLQGTIGLAGPEHALDEDASLALDSVAANPASEPMATALTRLRQPVAGNRQKPPAVADSPMDVVAQPIAGGTLSVPRSPARAALSGGDGADQAPAVAEPSQRLTQKEGGATARPPRGSMDAEHEHRGGLAPAVRIRTSSPLSAASLAHRVAKPPDEPTVVHVTIGRIEVVANVVPPTSARRGPTPRQPTVALADYLRGEQGGRR